MLKNFHNALLVNDDTLFFDEDFSQVIFFLLKNYILDYNFYEDDPEAIIHV